MTQREIKFQVLAENKIVAIEKLNGSRWQWQHALSFNKKWFEGDYGNTPNLVRRQYAGLKDKNKIEGYEGDVIERDSSTGKGKVRGVIVFERGGFGVKWGKKNIYGGWNEVLYLHLPESEIIGNIYSRPDLLK